MTKGTPALFNFDLTPWQAWYQPARLLAIRVSLACFEQRSIYSFMLFKKDITLYTQLSVDELYDKIDAITQPSYKYRYRARVDKASGVFYLLQLFDYGNRNMIRPEITGEITDNDNKRIINVKFRLPYELKLLFIGALVFNTIIYILLVLGEILPKEADFMIIGLPICIVMFFIISLSFFNSKASFSIELLTRVLKAKKLS